MFLVFLQFKIDVIIVFLMPQKPKFNQWLSVKSNCRVPLLLLCVRRWTCC